MQANTIAENALREVEAKYSQDFEISSVGGAFGTSDNSTWKVILHPKADPTVEFVATVDKQSSEVTDYYLSSLMSQRLGAQLESELGEWYEGRILVVSHALLENKTDPEVGSVDMSPAEFFEANGDEMVAVAVLVDADTPPRPLGDMVTELGMAVGRYVPRALVYVALAPDGSFDELAASSEDHELQDIAGYSVNGRGAGAEVLNQTVEILYVN